MPSAWQFESQAYFYFGILKSFLTWLCFSDFFFQHKTFLKAILYLGDLAVLSLFLMAWQWQPAIQLTFFRFLCRGSHRVLPCEQRPYVSIFQRDSYLVWQLIIVWPVVFVAWVLGYLVSWCFFPRAQSVPGHVARSPWIHLALKREISCVSS